MVRVASRAWRRATAAPIQPSRISSKYCFFSGRRLVTSPARHANIPFPETFATTGRTQAAYAVQCAFLVVTTNSAV
jgi:hypothetical protein